MNNIEKPYQPSEEEIEASRIEALRQENAQRFKVEADKHNKERGFIKKIFGSGKISEIDIAHKEALRDNKLIDHKKELKDARDLVAFYHRQIKEAEAEKEVKDMDREERLYVRLSEAEKVIKSFEILPHLRRASAEDYKKWLGGYIQQGGKIANVRNDDHIEGLYVAVEDFKMFPLSGFTSIDIIVPRNVKFLGGGLGHCELYFEDGYRVVKGGR